MALYPPIIPGQLPPAVLEESLNVYDPEDKTITSYGYKLTIPYEISRGVNPTSINSYRIIIKGIPSNKVYYQGTPVLLTGESTRDTLVCTIVLPASHKLYVGNYYKLQLAFVEKGGNAGYYSTVGTFKLIARPNVDLEETNGEFNFIYTPNANDVNERLYTTQFYLYEQDSEKLLEQSEKMLYNYDNQTDFNTNRLEVTYRFNTTMQVGKLYKGACKYATVNGYTKTVYLTDVVTKEVYPSPNRLYPDVSLDYDNGLINISIKKRTPTGRMIDDDYISTPKELGNYILSRASNKDNYQNWEKIANFSLNSLLLSNNNIKRIIFKDISVEQGIKYQYALQQISDTGLYSSKNYSDIIMADYEDMYLTDGKRQLRIAYNPKVSTFKETIMENKQDTIGGKYPFFFRNNEIHYKEFNISGLLSYLADPDNLFGMDFDNNIYTTNLISENIHKEKQFKLEVLSWLNNGEVKLFKTAAEGNYYVRLMNVSLSPTDTVGRMLHTFSATGYEVEPMTNPYVINKISDYIIGPQLMIKTLQGEYRSGAWRFTIPSSERSKIKSLEFLGIEQKISGTTNPIINPIEIQIIEYDSAATDKVGKTQIVYSTEVGKVIEHNKQFKIKEIVIKQSKQFEPIINCQCVFTNEAVENSNFLSQSNLITDPSTGNPLRVEELNEDCYKIDSNDPFPSSNNYNYNYFGAVSYCYDFIVVDEKNENARVKEITFLDQEYKSHTFKVNKQLNLQNIFVTGIVKIDEDLKLYTTRIKYVWR